MDFPIKRHDAVYTSDGTLLGEARYTYKNPNEADINPALKLFGEYLYVFDVTLPDGYFIPVDYIASYDTEAGVKLSISKRQVFHETLTREPQFIAFGGSDKNWLPE